MTFEVTVLVVCFLLIVIIGSTVDYIKNLKKYAETHRINKILKLRYERLIQYGGEPIDW